MASSMIVLDAMCCTVDSIQSDELLDGHKRPDISEYKCRAIRVQISAKSLLSDELIGIELEFNNISDFEWLSLKS